MCVYLRSVIDGNYLYQANAVCVSACIRMSMGVDVDVSSTCACLKMSVFMYTNNLVDFCNLAVMCLLCNVYRGIRVKQTITNRTPFHPDTTYMVSSYYPIL